ncbi:hypothetical protein BH11ARM2_BH11ARM2_14650 [soil metagenome]
MPAYDTPPPPPTAVLRDRPLRAGPVALILGGAFVAGLLALLNVRRVHLEEASAPLREKSITKTRKLAQAALLYAEDHETFYADYNWHTRLKPYGIAFADIRSPVNGWSIYTMSRAANRKNPKKLAHAERFVLFGDGYGGGTMSYAATLEDLWNVAPYRKGRDIGNVFSFADGHSAFFPQADWKPEDSSEGTIR